MKHFRLVAVVFVAALPACLVYDSDLLSQGEGGSVPGDGDGDGDGDVEGDGDGDGDGDNGTGGVVLSGGSGGGGTGGSGDGDGDGDGDGESGGMGGDPGGSGGTDTSGGSGGESSGGSSSGGANTAGSCPNYTGADVTAMDLVDDMRLAANAILTNGDRKGDWLAFHGTSMETVPSPNASGAWPATPMELVPETSSDYALHYQATKTGEDNAQIWQQFGFLLDEGNAYDLSSYTGLLFCARRDASTLQSLSLRVTERVDADPMNDVDHETTGGIIPVEWAYIRIPFDTAWPASALTGAKSIWFLGGNGIPYDIWIDNIYLYTE